ncbi:hypothetical protein, partial [Novipirellula maiorica]|uniref:hypothetical protein n=1 Tax=Novipirellula maiorica TaxID=1265734 RepID=UPI001F1CE039
MNATVVAWIKLRFRKISPTALPAKTWGAKRWGHGRKPSTLRSPESILHIFAPHFFAGKSISMTELVRRWVYGNAEQYSSASSALRPVPNLLNEDDSRELPSADLPTNH